METITEIYNKNVLDTLNTHAPSKKRTISNRPSAPWYTLEIKQAKQHRRAAERKWKKTKLTIDKQIYEHHINIVKEMILLEKKKFFNNKIVNCENSKALFDVVNELKGNSKIPTLPASFSMSNLPDKFAEFFVNKIHKIRNNLDESNPMSQQSHNNGSICFTGNVFTDFKSVSKDYVKKVILSSPQKSCVLDPMPTTLLCQCLDPLLDIITEIINLSLKSGIVPTHFKKAVVCPLLKKQNLDSEELKNYRPVSNLPFISKILEKIVLAQLKEYLKINNLIEPYQSAYRENHSTETALLRIVNDLLMSVDEGNVAILTLLDLSAAFDTIDHSILLTRLSTNFGIRGNVLSWFKSYLSERSQSVIIQGVLSKKCHLEFGVPQGSVLGPVLYTMYTMPLACIFRQHKINYHMYADDSQLYKSVLPLNVPTLVSELHDCCEDVKIWMSQNKLKLNNDKTEVLLCSTSTKLSQVQIGNVVLAGADIKISTKAKNLGVYIDKTLSMDTQVDNIVRSMYFEIRNISRLKSFLDTESVKKLVVSLVLSRLDYCNSLLVGITAEKLTKLQRAQNSAARLVLEASKQESSTNMLITLHWLPVRARIEYKIATICFRVFNNTAPSYINDILCQYVPQRDLRSQDSRLLMEHRSRLKTFGDRSISKAGPTIWNSLPKSLRCSESFAVFKKGLKTYLFDKYLQ